MAAGIMGVFGQPGYRTTQYFTHKFIFRDGTVGFWPGGLTIDTTKTRDVAASSDNSYHLRPGTLMGKITASGYYANCLIGITTGALAANGTSITISAAQAVELVRRQGSTGTFTLTGPPTANGTSRQSTITYSAVDTTTGVVTITAPGTNDVQTLNFTNSPAGTFRLKIIDSSGVAQYTQRITYSATIGTLLTNLQAATDAVLAANAIVWSGTLVTAVAGTFSGTGYAALPQTVIEVDTDALTAGDVDITHTTTGGDGRFVAGSVVGPTDGSQNPISFIDGGYGLTLFTDLNSAPATNQWPQVPIFGTVEVGQLPYWPTDTGLKRWIRDSLSTTAGAKFIFSDQF